MLIAERGGAKIPWLGSAFATKFWYFAHGSSADPTLEFAFHDPEETSGALLFGLQTYK